MWNFLFQQAILLYFYLQLALEIWLQKLRESNEICWTFYAEGKI